MAESIADLGKAVETVCATLEEFDKETQQRILIAASILLGVDVQSLGG